MKKTQKMEKQNKIVCNFYHIKIVIVIAVFAVISLLVSIVLHLFKADFSSSIFANIFAGLITGLIICLVGGAKQKNSTELIAKKEWLQELSIMIKLYLNEYHQLSRFKFEKFNGDENIYNFIYDVHVHSNAINSEILQKQFDKTINFKPREYCKEKFDYDANALIDSFEELHEKVEHIDIDCPSSKCILDYFKPTHFELLKLNMKVHEEIRELDIQISELSRSIF